MITRAELRAIKEAELTFELAHEDFTYDPMTGKFARRDGAPRSIANPQNREYNYAEIRWKRNGKLYQAHRVAWLMHYGVWPRGEVDHKDNDHGNNRIDNLRDCTHSFNLANQRRRKNSKTGVKGVYWDTTRRKWHAQIQVNGKGRTLGRFVSKDDAAAAYAKAAHETFGEFARLA